ncbi:MAG: hypothetical protein KDA61_18395 [Planctomycetales bacterium]|nr:hypothetical protein [Planctomycetales bacterium]
MHDFYSLNPVFGHVDERLRKEVFEFWKSNQAIGDPDEAWRRTNQVAIVIRNAVGDVVGVSTVYVALHTGGLPYYFYRSFVRPADRVYKLAHRTLLETRELLETLTDPHKPKGLVIVAENKKLMRKGMRRFLEGSQFVFEGWTATGEGVWKYDFAPLA